MEIMTTIGVAIAILYLSGFGGLYFHFSSLINRQLDFNDKILNKLKLIIEGDEIYTVVQNYCEDTENNSKLYRESKLDSEEE